ncbi:MAG: right-handed parallel beta-helix repeat-containing protein [Planctomycetota bacterium]
MNWERFRGAIALAASAMLAAPSLGATTPGTLTFYQWLQMYASGNPCADINGDGVLDPSDLLAFLNGLGPNSSARTPNPTIDSDCFGPSSESDDDGENGGGGGGGGDDGPPVDPTDFETDEDGWTLLEPSVDTRKIYVAANGNDNNTGRSPGQAVRTIGRGVSLLRDGRPDWLLIRRGDTFREAIGGWRLSGRSESEPMVVTTFGEGRRPRLITDGDGVNMVNNRVAREHLRFVGLHFEPSQLGTEVGFVATTNRAEDILIEDCYFRGYKVNISFDVAASEGFSRNIRIRRNVLLDAMGDSHSQGIFADEVDGLLIEGNVIDRNGWDHRIGRSDATIFAHNIYIQRSSKNVVVRDNVVMRASSHGVQMRPGGIVEANAFFRNPMSVLFANARQPSPRPTDRVADNLIVGGVDLDNTQRRSWGIHLQDVLQVSVSGNLIANSRTPDADGGWGISISGRPDDFVDRTLIEDNIIDDYGMAISINPNLARQVLVRGNRFYRSRGDSKLVSSRATGGFGSVSFRDNEYLHLNDAEPFFDGSRDLRLTDWRSRFEPSATLIPGGFVDQNRTLDTYAQSIGLGSANGFFNAIRQQRRGSWDPRLSAEALRDYFLEGYATR